MTLLEATIVLLTLLVLVALLLVGGQSWKNGTDRARCILNIRQMQMSVRAFSSVSEHSAGADLSQIDPPVNLLSELVGEGRFVPELPTCPANGLYFFDGDIIPEIGLLYMRCSLGKSKGHEPSDYANW